MTTLFLTIPNAILLADTTDFIEDINNHPKYCIYLGSYEYLFTSDTRIYKELKNKYDIEILNDSMAFEIIN